MDAAQNTQNPSITAGQIAELRGMMMAMPLPQLQAFAQQHMNGPDGGIIVGLASQISNAKKSAMQQAQQPQASVAQQAVQGIAPPESQGIGQLPAQNLEGMARGGITGYADGGDTDSGDNDTDTDQSDPATSGKYDPSVGMIPNMTADQAIAMGVPNALSYGPSMYYAKQGGRIEGGTRRFDVAGYVDTEGGAADNLPSYMIPQVQQPASAPSLPLTLGTPITNRKQPNIYGNLFSSQDPAVKDWNNFLAAQQKGYLQSIAKDPNQGVQNQQAIQAAQPTPATTQPQPQVQPQAQPMPATGAIAGRGMQGGPTASQLGLATLTNGQNQTQASASPAVDQNTSNPYAISTGTKSTGSGFNPNMSGLPSLFKGAGLTNSSLGDIADSLKQSGLLPEKEDNSTQASIDSLRAVQDAMGYDKDNKKVYDRLDEMDQKSQDLSDKQSALAIIQGGLAMIRSGNPWEAIAQGASKGVAAYGDAQDKLNKAQEQHALARIAADQAANSMAHGDADNVLKQMDEVANRNLKKDEYILNASTSMLNNQESNRTSMANSYLQAQASTQNAQIAANAPSAEVKTLQAFANNPALAEQYKNSPQYQAALRSDIVSSMHIAAQTLANPLATDEQKADASAKISGYQNQLQTMFNQNAPLPSGLPPGSKFVGTKDGKRVYDLPPSVDNPRGKRVIES
jgi:hypothetical protein